MPCKPLYWWTSFISGCEAGGFSWLAASREGFGFLSYRNFSSSFSWMDLLLFTFIILFVDDQLRRTIEVFVSYLICMDQWLFIMHIPTPHIPFCYTSTTVYLICFLLFYVDSGICHAVFDYNIFVLMCESLA